MPDQKRKHILRIKKKKKKEKRKGKKKKKKKKRGEKRKKIARALRHLAKCTCCILL